MHAEAETVIRRWTGGHWPHVLDLGGRDVNGSPRWWVSCDSYHVVDIVPGPGVDEVADAATWEPKGRFELVLCTEVAEHTPEWPAICATAARALAPGGRFLLTCATDPREPHSGADGGPVRPGEYYGNVDPARMREVLDAFFEKVMVTVHPRGDLYAVALGRA